MKLEERIEQVLDMVGRMVVGTPVFLEFGPGLSAHGVYEGRRGELLQLSIRKGWTQWVPLHQILTIHSFEEVTQGV